MSLNYVTLTLDLYDGQGNPVTSGSASFTPTVQLTDTTDHQLTVEAPVPAVFHAGGLPAVKLLATDNGAPLPGGWGWTISFSGVPGNPAGFTFFLPYTGGASQYLSSLSPVSTAVTQFPANPMTTLGDIIYGLAQGNPARLAGNTSSTKEFLTSTGSGSAATAPAYATIAAGDLPTGTTSAQGALQLDGTAGDLQPDGVAAAGAKGQAADAKHAHPLQPWQFLPESYGALGNGKVIGDATIAGGALSTLTSASAAFTSGDTGKHIVVNDAGSGGLPLCTTITYVNATTVTLALAASAAVTANSAFYATDDTAAINSAVSAAKTYALANGYFAEVVFAAKFYGLAGSPTQTGNGSSTPTFNSQVPLPYPAGAGTSQKLVIALTGAGDGSDCQYFESTVPNLQGTCLVSMIQAPSQPDATYGYQSVIGGPTGSAGFTGRFANMKAVITGLSVWTPLISKQYAIDLRYCGGMRVDKCSGKAFGSFAGGVVTLPSLPALTSFQNAGSVGLYSPVIGNNDDCYVGSFTAEGLTTGVMATDHFTALRIAAIYANVGLELNALGGISGVAHRTAIANYSCEASNAAISCNGGTMPVSIAMSVEAIGTADVQDAGNGLQGEIRWYSESETVPTVTGAANVRIVNDTLGPGVWGSPPSVPATTVAAKNTSYRDATVYLTSGGAAVTVIKVDSTTTGLTLGSSGTVAVRVPGGHSITLTYASTAPTWVWVLD